MKNISIITLLLISSVAFGQHPLHMKGPKAKNYMVTKTEKLQATQFGLFASPSDKYEAGANAKNRTITRENNERINVYPQTNLRRAKGANAKNRYVRVAKKANTSTINTEMELQVEQDNSGVLQ